MIKAYNINRHYAPKHSSKFDKTVGQWTKGQEWTFEKNPLKKNKVFLPLTRKIQNWWQNWIWSFVNEWQKKERRSVTEKNCLTIFTEYACPEKNIWLNNSLSYFTVLHRTNDLSDNIVEILKKEIEIVWSFQSVLRWEHWHQWHNPTCHFHQSCYCWLWYCWRVFRFGKPFLHNQRIWYLWTGA